MLMSALHAAGWHFGFDESAAYAFVVCPCVLIVHGHAVGTIEVDSFDAPEGNGCSAFVAFFDGIVDFFEARGTFNQGLSFEAGGTFRFCGFGWFRRGGLGFWDLYARRRGFAFGGGVGWRCGGTAAVIAAGVECGEAK